MAQRKKFPCAVKTKDAVALPGGLETRDGLLKERHYGRNRSQLGTDEGAVQSGKQGFHQLKMR